MSSRSVDRQSVASSPPPFRVFGCAPPPAQPMPLRAGPLTMWFDPESGFLRRVRLGDTEVIRGIYAAVRDRNWGTVPGRVRITVRDVGQASFRWAFESAHRQGDLHFVWRGMLLGAADGTIRYEFDGIAETTFLRNRIGFCVLHPIHECAGALARQTRTDGSIVACRFPRLIEPQVVGHGSFRDLRGLAHEVATGVWAELGFEGETFEMEDQRNWTDASFKTYGTPLTLPFPAEIRAGTRVRQVVTLRLAGDPTRGTASSVAVVSEPPQLIRVEIPKSPTVRLPALGLGAASHAEPLTEPELQALRGMCPAHLRLDVRLGSAGWQARLAQAASEADQLGARLELAIHLPRAGEGDAAAAAALSRHRGRLARVLALRDGEAATSPDTLRRVRALLGGAAVPVGAGSDYNFCELNRERALGHLALDDADFLFWPINPQVHAFDHLSVVESLEAQAATAASARAVAGGRALAVSPVTLRPRFNAVATGPEPEPPPGELPPQVDPRQLSLFGAAWTLGSLAALASARAESATYYETSGWRGVMERPTGSPLPHRFPSAAGERFPLFHVFSALAGSREVALVPASPSLTVLVAFDANEPKRMLVGNLTAQSQPIGVAGATGPFRAALLDHCGGHTTVPGPAAAGEPWSASAISRGDGTRLTLPPYGVLRLDLGGGDG